MSSYKVHKDKGLVEFEGTILLEIETYQQVTRTLISYGPSTSAIALSPEGKGFMLRADGKVSLPVEGISPLTGIRDEKTEAELVKALETLPKGWAIRLNGVAVRFFEGVQVFTQHGWVDR